LTTTSTIFYFLQHLHYFRTLLGVTLHPQQFPLTVSAEYAVNHGIGVFFECLTEPVEFPWSRVSQKPASIRQILGTQTHSTSGLGGMAAVGDGPILPPGGGGGGGAFGDGCGAAG
jgi:hypothetical protein